MNMLRYVFFESPYVLIPLLLVGTYVCLVLWLRRRTPRAKQALLVALLLCVALPIVQKVVVTSREQISGVCTELIEAYKAADVPGIAIHVAPNFREEDYDRERLLEAVASSLKYYQVHDAKLSALSADIDGDRAVVRFAAWVEVQSPEWERHEQRSTWTAEFVRIDGQWRLVGVRPRETPIFPFSRLSQLAR